MFPGLEEEGEPTPGDAQGGEESSLGAASGALDGPAAATKQVGALGPAGRHWGRLGGDVGQHGAAVVGQDGLGIDSTIGLGLSEHFGHILVVVSLQAGGERKSFNVKAINCFKTNPSAIVCLY